MTADERAIRDLIAQWHRATTMGDVTTILRFMSGDVVFLVSGKPPLKGRSAFGNRLRKLLKSNRIESTGEVEEIQISGDLAYSWTRLTVGITSLSGGTPNVPSGSTLSIFRKQPDGTWVLVRDANLLPSV